MSFYSAFIRTPASKNQQLHTGATRGTCAAGFFCLLLIMQVQLILQGKSNVMFIAWIVLAFICGGIGSSKQIGFWPSFFLSLLLTPIVGFIVAILSPNKVVIVSKPIDHKRVEAQIDKTASIGEQLKQLYELKESGAITQEEYEAAKAKVLA